MKAKIYHNPRCRKSREALALLQEAGIEPEIIEYLKTPPGADELSALFDQMDIEPREAMRTKEGIYKELDLKNRDPDRDELVRIITENPVLLERPVVVTDKGAVIARPPEKVKDII